MVAPVLRTPQERKTELQEITRRHPSYPRNWVTTPNGPPGQVFLSMYQKTILIGQIMAMKMFNYMEPLLSPFPSLLYSFSISPLLFGQSLGQLIINLYLLVVVAAATMERRGAEAEEGESKFAASPSISSNLVS